VLQVIFPFQDWPLGTMYVTSNDGQVWAFDTVGNSSFLSGSLKRSYTTKTGKQFHLHLNVTLFDGWIFAIVVLLIPIFLSFPNNRFVVVLHTRR
jgi:hypothetical protein